MPTQEPTPKPPWLPLMEARQERADHYFQKILKDQRTWYSQKAGEQKDLFQRLAISVVVLGALISVVQFFGPAPWVGVLTALLGAAVSVVRAADALLRPGETWQAYRKASEGMKREYRLYVNNADVYAEAPEEDAAYRLLVARVETVIAEEQQLFWQSQGKSPPSPEGGKTAAKGASGTREA